MFVGWLCFDFIVWCMFIEGVMDYFVFGLINVSICINIDVFILDDGFKVCLILRGCCDWMVCDLFLIVCYRVFLVVIVLVSF